MDFLDYHTSTLTIQGAQEKTSKIDRNLRAAVTENFEIEYGDESKLVAHFDSLDNQKSEAKIKKIQFLNNYYCKRAKFSVKTLLEEIKPVVTEKYEVEFRNK